MGLFGLVAMVDWSAANRPGPPRPAPDQIWIAWGTGSTRPPPVYFRTRREAEDFLRHLLAGVRGSALVGFDFPNAYPLGSGFGGGRVLAARLAGLIEDDERNRNNRFQVATRLNREMGAPPGPFWMCPEGAAGPALTVKRPSFAGRPYGEHRLVDAWLRARGYNIQSPWKLGGVGSVGGQMLVGLPVVHRLLAAPALAPRSRLWPFETDWDRRLEGIVHAEVWPSLFDRTGQDHAIKDARQVVAVRDALLDRDRAGALAPWFARPACLSSAEAARCLAAEGWILGADRLARPRGKGAACAPRAVGL